MNAPEGKLHIVQIGGLKAKLMEVGAHVDEDGNPTHGANFAVATLLMPIEDLRRLASAMFEWGELTFSLARILPKESGRKLEGS